MCANSSAVKLCCYSKEHSKYILRLVRHLSMRAVNALVGCVATAAGTTAYVYAGLPPAARCPDFVQAIAEHRREGGDLLGAQLLSTESELDSGWRPPQGRWANTSFLLRWSLVERTTPHSPALCKAVCHLGVELAERRGLGWRREVLVRLVPRSSWAQQAAHSTVDVAHEMAVRGGESLLERLSHLRRASEAPLDYVGAAEASGDTLSREVAERLGRVLRAMQQDRRFERADGHTDWRMCF